MSSGIGSRCMPCVALTCGPFKRFQAGNWVLVFKLNSVLVELQFVVLIFARLSGPSRQYENDWRADVAALCVKRGNETALR